MTLVVGWVGIQTPAGEPEQWVDNGSTVSASGKFLASSGANALVLRQQLSGYVNNPDETFVRVTSSGDPQRDGFYRLLSAQLTTVASTLPGGYLPFTIMLEPVQGCAYPMCEMILRGANLTGKPAGVTAAPWHAIPSTWSGYDNGGSTVASANRALPGGVNMRVFVNSAGQTSYYGRDQGSPEPSAGVSPAEWYRGASLITFGGNQIVGRWVPIAGTVSTWSIDNEYFKIQQGGSSLLSVRSHNGTAWCTAQDIVVMGGGGGTFNGPRSFTVLRNSPEYCAILLAVPFAPAANASSVLYVQVGLRRGSRYAEIFMQSNFGNNWGLAMPAVTAMAHVDANLGANRATANDANGNSNRIVFGSATAYTEDLVNGKLYATSVNTVQADFLLGLEQAGSGSASPDRAVDLRDQYFAALSEVQSIRAQ